MSPARFRALLQLAYALREADAADLVQVHARLLLRDVHLNPEDLRTWGQGVLSRLLLDDAADTWPSLGWVSVELHGRLGSSPPALREEIAQLLGLPTAMALEEGIRGLLAYAHQLRREDEDSPRTQEIQAAIRAVLQQHGILGGNPRRADGEG